MSEFLDFSVYVVVLCLKLFDFAPGRILYRMVAMWFSVAVLMRLLNISISLSIEEVVITLGVVKFMFEGSCRFNCFLG